MKKNVIFLTALLSLSSLFAFGQTEASTNLDEVEVAASTDGFRSNWFVGVGEGAVVNKFKDNWFVGGGPMVQFFSGNPGKGSFIEHISAGAQIYGGKWVTPDFAFRFVCQGFSFSDAKKDLQSYGAFSLNMMANMQNLIGGYSENRVWNISPYIGPAMVITGSADSPTYPDGSVSGGTHYGVAMVAGLYNTFRMDDVIESFGDKVYLTFDLGLLMADKEFDHFARDLGTAKYDTSRGLDCLYTITIGAVYKFPKRGWITSFIMY